MILADRSDKALKIMLKKLEYELTFIELFTYACYFGDELHKDDYKRGRQAIERINALRETVHARLR